MIHKNRDCSVMNVITVFILGFFILSASVPCTAADPQDDPDVSEILDAKNSYRIGIGDILEIITWKEPDFSRENILVRMDGKITFPLIDDIRAAGQTPHQLKQSITTLLKQYLEAPHVTVVVREPASQRFYILGEVARTGEYPLLKELTILQAFAMAGGFTEWATKKEIILIRKKRQGGNDIVTIDYKKLVQGKGLEQNVVLRADDTIIVP
ncbi:hypothetical protein JCM14469_08490 [Desulfatiferula olefinivorans]